MAEKQGLFKKFCLEGSVLGFKYLYLYPDFLSRCFWTCNLVFLSVFACMLSLLLYQRFEAMPTRISIENQYESVKHMPFPAVSVCSPNQITISAVKHFDRTFVDGNRSVDLESAFRQLLGFYEITIFDPESLATLENLINVNRYNVLEVMRSLPQSCDRFLKVCFFHGLRYPGCKGLFRPVLTHHGMCCIFNSPYYFRKGWRHYRGLSRACGIGSLLPFNLYKNSSLVFNLKEWSLWRNEQEYNFVYKKVHKTGLAEGLTIITDSEPEDAVDRTLLNGGATRVMFTDWNEFPSDDQMYLVYPGTESLHFIQATYTYCSESVKELPIENRDCLFESERPLQYFRRYHNSDCDTLCLAKAIEQVCHCLPFYLPNVRISTVCNVTSVQCAMEVRLQMASIPSLDQCECPRDCNSREYKVNMVLANFKGLPYLVRNIYSDIVFNKSTSLMHILFRGPVYVKRKQETVMSINTLISNVGGVFGLCIGCSFIGALEIGFYIAKAIRKFVISCLRRFRKRKVIKIKNFIH